MTKVYATTVDLEFTGDMFVIPNKHREIDDSPHWRQLAILNGVELNPGDKTIQVWFINNQTDNLTDHGIQLENKHLFNYKLEYVPAKMLEGIKEGDTLSIIVPIYAYENKLRRGTPKELKMRLNVTANQKQYRYGEFGTFEAVMEDVLR